MPSVFTDGTGNGYDLTITTSADWTIHSADMPDGGNSASLSTTLYQNAVYAGEDFCLPSTAGSDARTLSFWVNVTAKTNDRTVAVVKTNDTATTTTKRNWIVSLTASETVAATWLNTTAGNYLQAQTAALAAGWHHIVIIFQCGSSKSITVYVDTALDVSSSSTSGTPTTATSDVYEFYLGASRAANTEEMTDHMAQVDWFEYALTADDISDLYLAMVAT
jgi:hypothetical protein